MNDAGAPGLLSQAEKSEARLVVTSGEDASSAEPLSARTARLHFTFLQRLPGLGIFACGAYRIGSDQPFEIQLEFSEADFLADAARLHGRGAAEIFAASPPAAAGEAFLSFLPDPVFGWNAGLHLLCRVADGVVERHFAASTGHPAGLRRLIEMAPANWARAVARKAIAASVDRGHCADGLPRPLERLLRLVQRRTATSGGRIEKVWRINPDGVLIAGSLEHISDLPLGSAALVSLAGRQVTLEPPLPPTGRTKTGASAFAFFVEIGEPRGYDEFWFLELAPANGEVRWLPFRMPAATIGSREAIEAVLALVHPGSANLPILFDRAVGPAVDRLWAECRRPRARACELRFGQTVPAPLVSVIVPLYGRIDFLHHQIARFSNDPELRAAGSLAELIYVLDDPDREEEFRALAQRVHTVYGLPFRALLLDRRSGYSAANNFGAEAASGELLLLLNSDVLPRRARWIGMLARTYRALPGCGVLGCRLLLEDGSLQHAGMTFAASPVLAGSWANEHPAKGLPPALDPHPAAVQVSAVTGAALMIERALYHRLGGLCEDYVLGDYEDSDLCLKAFEAGLKTYYTPEVELYHLERQSGAKLGDQEARQRLTLYNSWKHAAKWGTAIPQVLRDSEGKTAAPLGFASALPAPISAASAPSRTARGRPKRS